MKINSISLISLVSTLTIVSSANAGIIADFYAGGIFGTGGNTLFISDDHNKSDSSLVFGGIMGVDIPLVRIEAEYNHLTSSDFHANTAMANAYLKLPTALVKPYFGAGVGILFNGKYDNDDTDTVAAYQAMLGLTIDQTIFPVKFDIEGQILYAPTVYEKSHTDIDFLEYNLRLKARYIF